jgi:hypothetical protein
MRKVAARDRAEYLMRLRAHIFELWQRAAVPLAYRYYAALHLAVAPHHLSPPPLVSVCVLGVHQVKVLDSLSRGWIS